MHLPRAATAAGAAAHEAAEGHGEVYHLAYHSEQSFGATPYLIRLPKGGGNVMVDCPRWSAPLADRLDAMGGVNAIFLTHCDDIADHERWAARFHAPRIMHALDVGQGWTPGRAEGRARGVRVPWYTLLADMQVELKREGV